ncbi:MAG: hypothetical protein IGS39_10445 [Calothrix sp. C42_A2020_038]|nr:hypothetical protein [Calothrix sp. C42_A2020_038]
MNKFFLNSTEKLWEVLLEKALPILLEYFVTELVKESIKQANKYPKTRSIKK